MRTVNIEISDWPRLFQDRRNLFRALLELSKSQQRIIEGQHFAQLFEILGQKQHILDRLSVLTKGQPQVWQSWRTERDQLETTVRADCETLLAETDTILKQLLRQEDESTNLLVQHRDTTQQQLQTITQGTRAHEAYRDSLAPATHRRLDIDQ